MSIRNRATASGRPTTEFEAVADHASLANLTDLAVLDPARAARPRDARGTRAQALLDRVLSEPRPTASTAAADITAQRANRSPRRPGRGTRPWPTRRWVLTGSAVALVTAGLIAVPLVPDPSVSAVWTAVPAPMPADEVAATLDECVSQIESGPIPRGTTSFGPTADEYSQMSAVIAERRGAYTFLISTSDAWLVECWSDGTGIIGTGLSSLGQHKVEVAPDAAPAFAFGTVSWDDFESSMVAGRVGADVTKVVVTTPEGVAVESTVTNGYFAAWWPGRIAAVDGGTYDSSAEGVNLGDIQLEVHLADGTIIDGSIPADTAGSSFERHG